MSKNKPIEFSLQKLHQHLYHRLHPHQMQQLRFKDLIEDQIYHDLPQTSITGRFYVQDSHHIIE